MYDSSFLKIATTEKSYGGCIGGGYDDSDDVDWQLSWFPGVQVSAVTSLFAFVNTDCCERRRNSKR